MEMKLTLVNRSGKPVPRVFLKDWVRRMARLASSSVDPSIYRKKELVIVFLDEKEARRLNREYRGKDYATDVLSFEGLESSSLGELVICPRVISRQAKEHGLLVREELGYMVLHGFLHLLGYDHERSRKEEKLMFAIQDALFEKLLARKNSPGRSK
jgi:probable rRNA maturation factor